MRWNEAPPPRSRSPADSLAKAGQAAVAGVESLGQIRPAHGLSRLAQLEVKIGQEYIGIDLLRIVADGLSERVDGLTEPAGPHPGKAEIELGWAEIGFDGEGAFEGGRRLGKLLLSQESHAELEPAIDGTLFEHEVPADGRFGGGRLFSEVVQSAL